MSALFVRHGPKVAVGGLVALNLVLIGALALRDPVRAAVPAAPVPASFPSTQSGAATSPAPPTSSASPSTSAKAPNDPAEAPARLLAANSGQVAWRATSTDCDGEAEVEVTTDAGRSWSRTDPGLTAIVRLRAYGDGSVFAIGADKECRATYAWISSPKDAWQRDRDRVDDFWFQSPDDPDEVHAPGGRTTKPCGDELFDLAGFGTSEAAARCAEGRIRTTTDGRSWKTVQARSDILSLNSDDDGFVAAGRSDDCSGVEVRRFDSAGWALRSQGRCRPRVEARKGSTVVSVHLQGVWLWSGDSVYTY